MATRYDTCPTCSAQSSVSVCDNCHTDIPQGTSPAVSGRVWDDANHRYLPVELCATCAGQPVNLTAIVTD